MGGGDRVYFFLGTGHAVAVVAANRENTAIERKALLGEDVECPERSLDNRETRGSVCGHADAAGVVDRVHGVRDVGSELLGGEVVDQAMPISVRSDLVTGLGNPPDECGISLGNPAENEERGSDFAIVEEGEHAVGTGFNAALVFIPITA